MQGIKPIRISFSDVLRIKNSLRPFNDKYQENNRVYSKLFVRV